MVVDWIWQQNGKILVFMVTEVRKKYYKMVRGCRREMEIIQFLTIQCGKRKDASNKYSFAMKLRTQIHHPFIYLCYDSEIIFFLETQCA